MSEQIQVAFASGSEDLIPTLIEKMRALNPQLPLYAVSEFPVEDAIWVPYHVGRTTRQNLELCRSVFGGKRIRLAGLILQPRMPYWGMRLVAVLIGGLQTVFFNENLDHFMLRPWSLAAAARHVLWRTKNFIRWELRPGGATYTFLWRLWHPWAFLRPAHYWLGRAAGALARWEKAMQAGRAAAVVEERLEEGISVVVPSRNGRALLERLLPGLFAELEGLTAEVIVVDNGSDDGTADFLRREHPRAALDEHAGPLSFARAANRGIVRARYSRLVLLNNDMELKPGFFAALTEAFGKVPDLFCATAEILFPEGERRQETGKAAMPPDRPKDDFPVACLEPVAGEDLTWVLYGSGGCSMFDTAKLRGLGGLREVFEPAYVEDLDLGFRGWQRGWPSVFVAGAKVVHRHRATTSRYYSEEELAVVLELNWLRFLAHTVASPEVFGELWRRALDRLNRRAAKMQPDRAAAGAIKQAWRVPRWDLRQPEPEEDERLILAIGSGQAAVFPGRPASGKPRVLVASPYLPFPLAHGGAVRMYNLMRGAARDYDQTLVAFADDLAAPPRELLDICVEVVAVRREGSHARPLTNRPDVVEEFDSPVFHAALRQTSRKWRPEIAQLEFTQMAQYAGDCGAAKTILVEHDITLDLYAQLLAKAEDWETRQQHERWVRFETAAWRRVDAVVTMSEKDRRAVEGPAVCLENGVDLERFRPCAEEPEPGRLLFIGSFAHLPNVLAVDFFLREVWPALAGAQLHIIAGKRHAYFLERYRDRVQPALGQPGVEVEDFVADPRPAYRRAAVVVAPLVASAGTNIKIMEAMAMGKAIVSTAAGINGLEDLRNGHDVLVADRGERMAGLITELLESAEKRRRIGQQARATAERLYGWEAIAGRQKELYESLRPRTA